MGSGGTWVVELMVRVFMVTGRSDDTTSGEVPVLFGGGVDVTVSYGLLVYTMVIVDETVGYE